MNIFYKRPLSLILCITLCGFFVFTVSSTGYKILLSSLLAIAISASFIIPVFKKSLILKICLCVLGISFLCSQFYFGNYFYLLQSYSGDEVSIKGKVSYTDERDSYTEIYISVYEINGSDISQRTLLLRDYEKLDNIDSGDIISFKTKIESYDDSESVDYNRIYAAKGISAIAYNANNLTKHSSDGPTIEAQFEQLRDIISDYAVILFGEEPGGFLSAVLLGNTEDMDSKMEADFVRLGISHILALSGMHLTILCGGLSLVLYLLRIDKRIIVGFTIVFCIFFMLLVAMPMSVVRAGLMLIISSILYLCLGCRDGITNLFISVFIIVACTPYAILDIGLLLSALATFGILVGSNTIEKRYSTLSRTRKFLNGIIYSFYYSLFAITATSAISAICFSGISWFSAPATLLFGFLTEIYLYVAVIALPIGLFFTPVGIVLRPIYDLLYYLSDMLSDIQGVYTSVEFPFVKFLAILTSVMVLFYAILKIKNKRIYIMLLSVCLILLYSSSSLLTLRNKYTESVIFSSENGDRFLVNTNGESFLIDSALSNSFYDSVIFAQDYGACDIDNYIAMNYNAYMKENITLIMLNLRPEKVMLPLPRNCFEDEIATEIYNMLTKFDAKIEFYRQGYQYQLGEFSFVLAERSTYRENSFFCVAIIEFDNTLHGYVSSGALESCNEAYEILYVCESIVFGKHGAPQKNIVIDEVSHRLKKAVICDDNLYFRVADESIDVNVIRYKKPVKLINGLQLIID